MRTMRSTVDLEDGGTEVRMSSDSRSRSAAKASADRTARRRAFCILWLSLFFHISFSQQRAHERAAGPKIWMECQPGIEQTTLMQHSSLVKVHGFLVNLCIRTLHGHS